VPVDAPIYPVGLVLRDRPCLVVGGGRIASRKVEGLVACGARVTVIAPDVIEEITAQPDVVVVRRVYRDGDLRGFLLVITATGEPEVDGAVFADAERAGVWLNSADDPDHCSFILPAVLRREPVVVSVSTAGHSPALATWLRDRVAAVVGDDVGRLARRLSARRRAIHASGGTTEGMDWTPIIEELAR
jgi:siroheme synthase-like protein